MTALRLIEGQAWAATFGRTEPHRSPTQFKLKQTPKRRLSPTGVDRAFRPLIPALAACLKSGDRMTTRRELLLALSAGALSAAAPAFAQLDKRVIGYLGPGPGPGPATEAVMQGLRKLGWIEGQNLRIEFRWAENKPERLPALAQELVKLNVELIVGQSTPAVQAAKNATGSIPIVMGSAADAEGSGFVASLARPGRNITGVSLMLSETTGKRLQILRDIVPRFARVAYLAYASDPSHKLFLNQMDEAGRSMKIRVQPVIVNGAQDFPSAFAAMSKERAGALVVQPLFASTLGLGPQVAELANSAHLPSISDGTGFADQGGLIFYGPDPAAIYERIAGYVDRILKGGNPAQMPVEQPTKFELVINMKAAKAMGLKIPQLVLLQADRVIE
jgi:putative ABC transport system substrate-binding protein